MIALIQRVNGASVTVEGKIISSINKGFLILLGVFETDTEKEAEFLAKKTVNLRIFEDENQRMNLSPVHLKEKGESCEMLVVSQFTLCAECKGQNRPSFMPAAAPEYANKLYEYYRSLSKADLCYNKASDEDHLPVKQKGMSVNSSRTL